MKRKIILSVLLVLLCLAAYHHKIIIYGIQQGAGQWNIVTNTRPIDSVLADASFPDSLKAKIRLVQKIRQFAIDSLGLNNTDNYTTLYDQKGKPVLWVVTACLPYKLESYKWDYPFLGELSYKGFFVPERAEKEAQRLKEEGYDTDIGTAAGWSTLGYFTDPILSNMLYRSEGDLSNLIIHELTHATLYVKDNAQYNENLATFIGHEGAKLFLQHEYGYQSAQYTKYIQKQHDVQQFTNHILRGAIILDSLYSTFENMNMTDSVKQYKKQTTINQIVKNLDTVTFYNRGNIRRWIDTSTTVNNTFFTDIRAYHKQLDTFEIEFKEQFHSEFHRYLSYLKQRYASVGKD